MEHPITPPPELVRQWAVYKTGHESPVQLWYNVATQAARWGADQELEACIDVILAHPGLEHPELLVEVLRAARRPKPPSLAEQALTLLDDASTRLDAVHENTIRHALERLQELEKGNE